MAAAYVLALQVLLSGVAATHVMVGGGSAANDLFVICHGSTAVPADNQDVPDRLPLPRSPCVLCTLTASCAILPMDHSIAAIDAMVVANAVPGNDGRIIEFHSPTGQYQRGPPSSASISG